MTSLNCASWWPNKSVPELFIHNDDHLLLLHSEVHQSLFAALGGFQYSAFDLRGAQHSTIVASEERRSEVRRLSETAMTR